MSRTLNHYDALGYAEGWNLVAHPRTDENLFDQRKALENDLKHKVLAPLTRRVLRAKLAGLDSALTALRNEAWTADIVIGEGETWHDTA